LSYPLIQIDPYIKQLSLGRVLVTHHGWWLLSSFKFFPIISILRIFVRGFGQQPVETRPCNFATP
ncbi:MAG: hypothetical protein ACREOW_17625, partial [Thermodesulfobacteriota bacterium]